ncbi:MAG: hypothetical protein NPIRA06_12810 [Nitrospirales bacterium]|nr:MAG: hypothetical protein NPIRA06_12810 [Nitrospirales bacterium]
MVKVLGLVSGLVLGIQTTVCAGVVFHVETTFPNRAEMSSRNDAITVDGKKLKMTINDAGNTQSTVIYRGDREEILLINHGDHTWRAMDKATMVNLGQQINPAMEKMQKMLKNMPPERRAMMEKMFAGQGINPAMMGGKVEMQVKKTGESQTINGYSCVKYETWREKEKVAEHCVSDWKQVPGSQEAQGVFHDMASFSQEVWQGAFKGGGGPASFFESLGKMEGYPVLTRIFSNGTVVTESRLTGVEEKSVAAKEFDPPKDYVKKDFLPKNLPSHMKR